MNRGTKFQTRPQMRRLMSIHEMCLKGARFSVISLSRDFDCSESTLRRDVEFMRDQLGLPLQYDGSKHTWFYAPGSKLEKMKLRLFDSLFANK